MKARAAMKTGNADHQEHLRTVPVLLYSFDCNEPEHVHVQHEKRVCKYWLSPLALAANEGFSARELNQIRARGNTEHGKDLGGLA
jgi:hypothetical protein